MTTPTAPIPHPIDVDDQEKQREELAMLEGHDADLYPIEGTGATADALNVRQTSPSPADTGSTEVKDEEAGRISTDDKLSAQEYKHEREHPQADENDPNVVFWDGSDDPDNPVNWKESLKWANVATIAAITFITYVSLVSCVYVEDLVQTDRVSIYGPSILMDIFTPLPVC